MKKFDLKRIRESRFTQFLLLAMLIFQNIIILSVNTIFMKGNGNLFIILTLVIALYDSWIIVYCISLYIKRVVEVKDNE